MQLFRMADSSEEKPKTKHIFHTLPGVYMVSVMSAWNAEIFTFPFDLVKTRLQVQGEKAGQLGTATPYQGMTGTGLSIIKEEGFFKLWHGIQAVFLRQLIFAGIRVCTYVTIKKTLMERNEDKTNFYFWQSLVGKLFSSKLFALLIFKLLPSQIYVMMIHY